MTGVAHETLGATLAALGEMIAMPTVSADGNLEFIAYAQARLQAAGAATQMTVSPCGRKANLFATIGPEEDGGVMLAGHTDVVPVEGQEWSVAPFAASRIRDRVYGRGSCDMKGFLAACLAMAPRFAEAALARPLHIAMTYDEEVGCLGAPVMLERVLAEGPRPRLAIVGEPTGMQVIEGHKGMCEYTTRFEGLAGHGSDPGAGVSAVEYAVRYAARLLALRPELAARRPAWSRFGPPETTLQIGRLAGGASHNVIAERAEIDWELRPVTAEDRAFVLEAIRAYAEEELLPAMRAVHAEARIETEVVGEVAGLAPMPESAARALAEALTGRQGAGVVSFGTEAGIYQAAGIETVVCGPGHIAQAHKADEYIETAELDACLGMIERLIPRLAA